MAYIYRLTLEAFDNFHPETHNDEFHFDGTSFIKSANPPAFDSIPENISDAVSKLILIWCEYHDHVTTYLYEVNLDEHTEDKLIAKHVGC